ncbi:hypothetical protein BDN67DRAFT_969803 [Paxillus ammoniavirescens]|nr:hypothetical protein BDN67DRAFT_969803 [Paxillus ammoniavirescens]
MADFKLRVLQVFVFLLGGHLYLRIQAPHFLCSATLVLAAPMHCVLRSIDEVSKRLLASTKPLPSVIVN